MWPAKTHQAHVRISTKYAGAAESILCSVLSPALRFFTMVNIKSYKHSENRSRRRRRGEGQKKKEEEEEKKKEKRKRSKEEEEEEKEEEGEGRERGKYMTLPSNTMTQET